MSTGLEETGRHSGAALIPLVAIVGPTASGKTAAALTLAERVGAEIVSCDSMAVYRTLDVGPAKPTLDERARVPHHLVDVAEPHEPLTAARFAALADAAISDIAARGKPVIVVGGSGLYLRALLHGLFASPPPDPALRARLKAEAAERGWPALHERLRAVDPAAADRIHPTDPVRIERALEIFEQTGVPLSAHHAGQSRAPRYQARVFIVDPSGPVLDERIAARTDLLLRAGLVEETRRVIARYGAEVARTLKPLHAVGYKEAMAFLDGALDEPAMREAIRVATRRFARRQRTWFKKEPAGVWLKDAGDLPVWETLKS